MSEAELLSQSQLLRSFQLPKLLSRRGADLLAQRTRLHARRRSRWSLCRLSQLQLSQRLPQNQSQNLQVLAHSCARLASILCT